MPQGRGSAHLRRFRDRRGLAGRAAGRTGRARRDRDHRPPPLRHALHPLSVGRPRQRGAENCGCGRPFAKIDAIQGRMLDYFHLANDRWLHPYELVVSMMADGLGWINRYQLVHERADRIVLRRCEHRAPPPGRDRRVRTLRCRAGRPRGDRRGRDRAGDRTHFGGKFRVSRWLFGPTTTTSTASASARSTGERGNRAIDDDRAP